MFDKGDSGVCADLERLRGTILGYFPSLWSPVEAGLATYASLLLSDNVNPVALILVGPPGSSKTTVAKLLMTDDAYCYRSDSFSAASFVSHAASVDRTKLEEIDLLPRIKHKMLITPELASMFRGKEDELIKRFGILIRVLDGDGLMTDSGTHGRRGYEGDYLFAWLGCTTPFDAKVWGIMSQLGSRLFFFRMKEGFDITVEDLKKATDGIPFGVRMNMCQEQVGEFIKSTFSKNGGVRGVMWDASGDTEDVKEWLARLAMLLAKARSLPTRDVMEGLSPLAAESPYRAQAVLRNLARGRALLYERRYLTKEDLPLITYVAVSTMPEPMGRVFRLLVNHRNSYLTVSDVQSLLGVRSPQTARQRMQEIGSGGIAEFIEDGIGKEAQLRLRESWEWCRSDEFRGMLCGE